MTFFVFLARWRLDSGSETPKRLCGLQSALGSLQGWLRRSPRSVFLGKPELRKEERAEKLGPPYEITSLDAGEFWLGLEKMHSITGDRGSQMAVQLQDWDGNAKLLQFPIHLGGEDTAYSLQLTEPTASELGATNVSPNGLSLPFSTWDQDHDLRGDLNCAKTLSGKQVLLPL